MAVLGFTLPPDSGEKLSLGKEQTTEDSKVMDGQVGKEKGRFAFWLLVVSGGYRIY